MKYSVSICSFLVFDMTLELYHSCNENASEPAEMGKRKELLCKGYELPRQACDCEAAWKGSLF